MADYFPPEYSPEAVRDDFVPKADFLDRRVPRAGKGTPLAQGLADRLPAGRDLPSRATTSSTRSSTNSILVVRGADGEVRAFHNVCPHRGTLLAEGEGNAKQFVCPFHGWRFGTDGRSVKVIDRQDWGDCLAQGRYRSRAGAGRHAGAAGCGSTWTPTASRWRNSSRRWRRCASSSNSRSCAPPGTNRWWSRPTGRRRSAPSPNSTTSRRRMRRC